MHVCGLYFQFLRVSNLAIQYVFTRQSISFSTMDVTVLKLITSLSEIYRIFNNRLKQTLAF